MEMDILWKVKLSNSDIVQLHLARDLILERMTDPPTLIELSRMVGLNDHKLKHGFKAVFGMTVFGYLREKRMEKALQLLQQGLMNVSETSLAVGYSNPSYFAEMFRHRFGVNPSDIHRQGHT